MLSLETARLVHWCAKLCEGMAPGDKLLTTSIGSLRKHFAAAVKVFRRQELDVQLCPMR